MSSASGRYCRLRVSISEWRGAASVELRDATATIPGVYMPTPYGVTLPLEKLGELIEALGLVKLEAKSRGLL
jgi:hypothetical protein